MIIEIKLPPSDAYLKIKLVLDDINCVIQENMKLYKNEEIAESKIINPLNRNVFFSSSKYNILFDL